MIHISYPLVWTQAVVDKLWNKHKVTPEEVEEVVCDDKPIGHKATMSSYCIYGQAVSGRYLFVVVRKTGRGSRYRVVTARNMEDKERKYYATRRT